MRRALTIRRIGFVVLLTVAAVLVCSVVSAQSPAKLMGQNFEFGVRGGISWAELVHENSFSGIDSRMTFSVGGFWAFPVSSRFALQPELTYKRYGHSYYVVYTTEDYPDGYAEGVFSRKLDYVAISSMVRFQPLNRGILLPFLLAGPRLDVKVRAEQGLEDDYYDIHTAKKATFGLDFGGMLVLNLETPIFIDIRGSLGLTEAFDIHGFRMDGTTIEAVELNVKGNMLSITAGFIFM
ncbi:MAG: PorT family protein [Candidatus Zixiibacteriota bacterium]|nr:MAG: PorT family protein [candidate division Zixibacteria bacterium]